MTNKSVLHINKNAYSKGDSGRVAGIVSHCLNRTDMKHVNTKPLMENVHHNIAELEKIFVDAEKKLLKGKGKTNKRSSHSVMAEVLLSASHDFFQTEDDAKKWADESIKFLEKEYGKNLVAYSIHFDEKTPHLHAFIVPTKNYLHYTQINKETGQPKINQKTGQPYEYQEKIFYNERFFENMSKAQIKALTASGKADQTPTGKLHSRYAEFLQEQGLNIERGAIGSEAVHLEPTEYWGEVDKVESISKMKIVSSPSRVQQFIKEQEVYQSQLEEENQKLKEANTNLRNENAVLKSDVQFLNKKNDVLKEYAAKVRAFSLEELQECLDYKIDLSPVIDSRGKKKEIKNCIDYFIYKENKSYAEAVQHLSAVLGVTEEEEGKLVATMQEHKKQDFQALSKQSFKNQEIILKAFFEVAGTHGKVLCLDRNQNEELYTHSANINTFDDFYKNVNRYKSLNAKGLNVQFKPASESFHFITLDLDDKAKADAFLNSDKVSANLVIETSSERKQAIIKLDKKDFSYGEALFLSQHLNRAFGDEKKQTLVNALPVPSFCNKKEKYSSPIVLLEKADAEVSRQNTEFFREFINLASVEAKKQIAEIDRKHQQEQIREIDIEM